MARYDVYVGLDNSAYFLDVQADLLDAYITRVVVPLIANSEAPDPAKRLNPIFEIDGHAYVMMTQLLAAIPSSTLKQPITNLSNKHDVISNALDMVFYGF